MIIMSKFIEIIRDKIPYDIFTDEAVRQLIRESPAARYGLVKRAISKGELIHLRRGLYGFSEKYQRRGMNLFELAQMIYGPSYISFESALSHHGWIPEAVYTVTSSTMKRSKTYDTPLGAFSYTRIPAIPFFAGVERIENQNGIFFMATPWKALADYVYANKKNWQGTQPLIQDLRIEEKYLKRADPYLLNELKEHSNSLRVKEFIEGVKKSLKKSKE